MTDVGFYQNCPDFLCVQRYIINCFPQKTSGPWVVMAALLKDSGLAAWLGWHSRIPQEK